MVLSKKTMNEFIKYVKENYDIDLIIEPSETTDTFESLFINDNCKKCSNHPKNGGSGICHCVLGSHVIY